jgi:hypothetical protein
MYDVSIHPQHQLMKIKVEGFWSIDDMACYAAELRRASTALTEQAGACRRIFVDMSDYPIQSADVAAGHATALQYASDKLGASAALVLQGALAKMQATRVLKTDTHRVFADERSAMQWLMGL